jgi:hypothetical protein
MASVRGRFAAEIDQFRRGGLHAEGQFIAGDAGGDFGVVNFLEAFLIQLIQRVEVVALKVAGNSRRIGQIQNRLAFISRNNTPA